MKLSEKEMTFWGYAGILEQVLSCFARQLNAQLNEVSTWRETSKHGRAALMNSCLMTLSGKREIDATAFNHDQQPPQCFQTSLAATAAFKHVLQPQVV